MAAVALVIIAAAEFATSVGQPTLGMAVYGLLLLALLAVAGLSQLDPAGRLGLALALIPLMRLTALGLPLAALFPAWRYLLAMAVLLVAVALSLYYLRVRPTDVGLSTGGLPALSTYLPVALTGLPLGILEYSILHPAPFAMVGLAGGTSVVLLSLAVGFLEELVFRGILLFAARRVFGQGAGIVYAALLYTALQAGYHSWWHAALALTTGLFFGWVAARTRTIFPVSLAHGFANMIIFGLRP